MGSLIRLFRDEDFAAICLLEIMEKGATYPSSVFIRQASVLYPTTFLVAEKNGDLTGYCIGALREGIPSEAWILRLRVSLPHRRRRIGSDLVGTLLKIFLQKKVSVVYLSVAPENGAARNLYMKFGFEDITFKKGYFGEGEDRIIMAVHLSPSRNMTSER
ncbi:MAG: GNAT family N-acetyltransferase [Methanoregulaceae archaeon]|nr:GNAT family N-acetyltransferase [Methanoregulaceae archaeon]